MGYISVNTEVVRNKMKIFPIFSFLVISFAACFNSKTSKVSACEEVTITTAYLENDTSRVIELSARVYDTTVYIIQGKVIDFDTRRPLINAKVTLTGNGSIKTIKINKEGRFEFSGTELRDGKWDLMIESKNHHCLIANKINRIDSWAFLDYEFKIKKIH